MHILYGNVTKWALATSGVKLARPHAIVDFTQQEHPWCLPLNQLTLGTILDAATADRSVRSAFFASPNRFYIPSSRSGELLAAAKSVLLPFSVVEWRFSTVYGEFGRTDYPYYKFVEDITSGQDVQLWQQRKGRQNYIYIDDAVAVMIKMILDFTHVVGAVTVVDIGTPTPALSFKDVVRVVTKISGKKAKLVEVEDANPPPWEVEYVPPSHLYALGKFTSFQSGMARFIDWYEQKKSM
ncbi:hypothetical protein SELMODRAFT_90555 [Selaginella moellendorffii]|uniref:NAD-dependent epimerase/dehydratase domain-containing protein n=2 Tax=Selaginella moellendorffii TaxID=88036 RepID=D8RDA6_SELML|nr:hypothetical protein SELMODRAFT_90555 [Selaginella moellendorffii]